LNRTREGRREEGIDALQLLLCCFASFSFVFFGCFLARERSKESSPTIFFFFSSPFYLWRFWIKSSLFGRKEQTNGWGVLYEEAASPRRATNTEETLGKEQKQREREMGEFFFELTWKEKRR
jgi:hypothetical protein